MSFSIQDALMIHNKDVLKHFAQKFEVADKSMTSKVHFAEAIERQLTLNGN